ncbi:MAG TPA: VOC family protein [Burkholderiaceae bacterium]|nr:VOC family protein [Burkholderiaceae bacterium]
MRCARGRRSRPSRIRTRREPRRFDRLDERLHHDTGGRVFLFLYTDDFARDHARLRAAGVTFVREPKHEPYGTVAVFRDPWGNLWDLVEPAPR